MKKGIIIIVVIIAIVLFFVLLNAFNNKPYGLNKEVDIKQDQIKLTVLESEKVTINKPALELNGAKLESTSNGDYIKVKISINNYGNKEYNWSATTFHLGDEGLALHAMGLEDFMVSSIPSGKTETGYLYFPVVDSDVLTYSTHMEASSSNSVKYEKYTFKIK